MTQGEVMAVFQEARLVALMLIAMGSWMMTLMNDLVQHLFSLMARL